MKRIKLLLSVLIACVTVAAIFGCKANERKSAQAQHTRNIVDMSGRTVVIPATVDRVAANGMSLTQLLLLLGAENKLVATMPTIKADPWYIRIFPHLNNIPSTFLGTDVNIERLIAVNPQVVFLWTGNDALRDKISSMGIPVVILSYSEPDGLKEAVFIMGNILGASEAVTAAKFIDYYDRNVKRVLDKTVSLPDSKRKKVYYVAGSPLNTEGTNSIVDAWIRIAGGVNVAAQAGLSGTVVAVSMENVVKWNPDVIIVRDIGVVNQITESPQWNTLDAVQKRRVYVNPKGVNVWSARSGDGALQVLWAAKTLHPKLFMDLDMGREVQSFYTTFYHHNLTREELDCVMQGTPPPR